MNPSNPTCHPHTIRLISKKNHHPAHSPRPSIPAQSVKAESVMKGSDLTGDATATYVVDKDLSAELKLSDKGAAKVSVTKSGVVGKFILILVRAIRLTSRVFCSQMGSRRWPARTRPISQSPSRWPTHSCTEISASRLTCPTPWEETRRSTRRRAST